MEKDFWALFIVMLLGSIACFLIIVFGIIFSKKFFLNKEYGLVWFIIFLCILVALMGLCVTLFVRCCKDLDYVLNQTYIEERARVTDFMYKKRDYDGNGQITYRRPKFYLIDKDEYIVLYTRDVTINETYLVRYYPNTKICEVIEYLP